MAVANPTHICHAAGTMSAAEPTRAGFERLLETHGGIVRKVAFSYTRGESDRRDLMQEIALQLWRAYPRYTPERPFSTWMYRIALNVAISFLRKNSRAGEMVPFDERQHDLPNESSASENAEESIARLHQLISTYPPLDRALLLLYLDDCSYSEIAAVLGLTATNVATKLSRLKQQLRQQITRKLDL